MLGWSPLCSIVIGAMLPFSVAKPAQDPAGSIRGVVTDEDFGVPLAAAQVLAVESGQKALTTDQGNYVLPNVKAGTYTLVFTKDGYVKQVKSGVLVSGGQLTEVDAALAGEFTDLDEFVVQDLMQFGSGSELALLKLRSESTALLDSVGAELMSRAGAGDAAAALRLVAGASIQGGKFAVIRGLPDRYVSSQLNGVRLPSADENKRAVELDQFPAAVIESIQVSKTFTPDQQGDASGGAVDLRTKAVPDEAQFQFKLQYMYNSQTSSGSFLTYPGGGFDWLGRDSGSRRIQTENLGQNWDGAVGVSDTSAPLNFKMSISGGGMRDIGGGTKFGGFASLFYERDSSSKEGARDDSYWVTHPGGPMTPQTSQGTPDLGSFKTALFDISQGKQTLRVGGFGTVGFQGESGSLMLNALLARNSSDTATLATDTRGKEYFFPGYDPDDPTGPGNTPGTRNAAPYLRFETLDFVERTTSTLQLTGEHKMDWGSFGLGSFLQLSNPVFDWTLSHSTAEMNEPDKRQFGAYWLARSYNPGFPPFLPPFYDRNVWLPYFPSENFNLGNLQRIWKDISEDSNQVALSVKLDLEQWDGHKGYLKLGFFDDQLNRDFNQESFSNFGDQDSAFYGHWDDPWSDHFPSEPGHPITASNADVDYKGEQDIRATYGMVDLPLSADVSVNFGARFESTKISIVNEPESDAFWFPPGADAPVHLNPGDADVTIQQNDVLPSLGLTVTPAKELTLRASYSQTVAHQTFKEITPIMQQEFLGGPVFIGNPELRMSALRNYDLRADYVPYEGALCSASWFRKDIEDPIEYVQRLAGFTYTTPINYPKGEMTGYELEVRQDLEHLWHSLHGFSFGANATFIDAKVTLPESEAAAFSAPGIQAPMASRDMTNAPDHLYNFFLTYDFESARTQVGLFYTVQGDTLVAGAGQSLGNFVPSLYGKEYDTLNLTLSHALGKHLKLTFQAKNLTNPAIEEVYRSDFIGADVTKTSYTKGIEYSLALTLNL